MFEISALKAKLRVFLTCFVEAMVTYAIEMTTTYSYLTCNFLSVIEQLLEIL